MKKYQQLSRLIRQQISAQDLRAGEKIPSVRSLSQQAKVSKNTVIRAYMLLEQEGVIEARERSGFVVRRPEPVRRADGIPSPREVRSEASGLNLIRAARDPQGIPLGSAHPSVQFPACRQFYRVMAQEAYRRANDSKVGGHYADPAGDPDLRELFAQRMRLQGSAVEASEIVVTSGAMEAISLALQSVASVGDVIAVEKPAYYGSLNCIDALGMKVLEIPCCPESGMDLDLLSKSLQEWPVKAILVNPTFNNPSGFTMPKEKRLQLLKIATDYDLPLIEDDIFGDLYFGKSRESTLKQEDQDGRVIYCNSLSKTLHSDIRLGWAAPGRYLERMIYMKYVSSIASPSIVQFAAARFLAGNQYERHLRRVRRHYRETKDGIVDAIYRYWPKTVQVSQPDGGFLLWCSLPDKVNGDALYWRAQRAGINITPGSLFSCDASFLNHIRLNHATWQNDAVYIGAIKTLGRMMKE